MGYQLHRDGHQQAFVAASAINPKSPVKIIGTSVPFVVPCGTNADRPFGVTGAATAGASGLNQGETVTVFEELNVVRAVAGASMGVGVEAFIGSTNGILMPALAASLFSASGHWVVGLTQTSPQAAGEVFSLYVKPRKA